MKAKPRTIAKVSTAKTRSSKISTRKKRANRVLYPANLLDYIADALIATDMGFNVLEWNTAAEGIYGWTAEEVIGKPLKDFLQTNYQNTDEVEAARMIRQTGTWSGEVTQLRKDGTRFPVMASVSTVNDTTGRPAGFVAINRDITDRRQAERALLESKMQIESVFNSTMDAIITLDEEQKIIIFNSAAEQMFGCQTSEAVGETLDRFLPEYVRKEHIEYLHAFGKSNSTRRSMKTPALALTCLRANGEIFSSEVSISQLEIGGAKLYTAIVRDVTKPRQVEEKLLSSETRYRRLFESAKDGILILDAETGLIIDVNPFLITLLGYSKEAFFGKNIWELGFFKDIVANKTNFLELQRKEYIRYEDLPLETADGRRINVEFVSNVYEVDHQKVIQCNVRDITERKRAEAQIQRQLQRLNSLRAIDTAISSSFDINVTLDIVLQQVLSLLGADAAAILLFNTHEKAIEYAASRGFHSNILHQTQLKLSEGYAGRAVREHKTIHIPALPKAGGKLAEVLRSANEGFVDYYGTPLISKDGIKGVLEIYHRAPLDPDSEWLDFLETLAGQAAIAIDNAQLFDSLQRSNAELEKRVLERTSQLNHTNAELEQANRIKDEFLANMSHELRTPLNSILGLSESLLEERRGSLNDHQQRSLQIIEASGHHLLDLINDILDLSKIEAGKLDYYPQPVSIDELCRSSLAFIGAQAVKKSIAVTYENQAALKEIVADPRRLKQILVNLLTNAVKFTPDHGTVTLQVNTQLEQEIIQFSVIDTGIGIAPEDMQKLFQPFVQLDSDLNRQYEGTGLGLALVQKLADLHGGSVQVESDGVPGKGSRFTINLTCRQNEFPQPEKPKAHFDLSEDTAVEKTKTSSEGSTQRKVILLAEDNVANVLVIGEYVESRGYEVVIAHNGMEAVEKAESLNPDIFLMDIQMPVMNGLDAIAHLRADSRFATTPILALTALAMPGDRERCLSAGADEYMSKPVSLKKLAETIARLLEKKKK